MAFLAVFPGTVKGSSFCPRCRGEALAAPAATLSCCGRMAAPGNRAVKRDPNKDRDFLCVDKPRFDEFNK